MKPLYKQIISEINLFIDSKAAFCYTSYVFIRNILNYFNDSKLKPIRQMNKLFKIALRK